MCATCRPISSYSLQLRQISMDRSLQGTSTDGTNGARFSAVCAAGEMAARKEDNVLFRSLAHQTRQRC